VGEQGHLTRLVAPVGAARVRVHQVADGEPVGYLRKGQVGVGLTWAIYRSHGALFPFGPTQPALRPLALR